MEGAKGIDCVRARDYGRYYHWWYIMLSPIGFWSYSNTDDDHSRGRLSQLRALLASELQQKIGRKLKVNIFQDVAAIPPGAEWEKQIRDAIMR